MIDPDLVMELAAQLEAHQQVKLIASESGKEVQVTEVEYDSEHDCIIVWVSA
jgi:hypothetical protein